MKATPLYATIQGDLEAIKDDGFVRLSPELIKPEVLLVPQNPEGFKAWAENSPYDEIHAKFLLEGALWSSFPNAQVKTIPSNADCAEIVLSLYKRKKGYLVSSLFPRGNNPGNWWAGHFEEQAAHLISITTFQNITVTVDASLSAIRKAQTAGQIMLLLKGLSMDLDSLRVDGGLTTHADTLKEIVDRVLQDFLDTYNKNAAGSLFRFLKVWVPESYTG